MWLDYPARVQMQRLVRRTVKRRLERRELWNGNVEPALHTFFTDADPVIRWGWRTRDALKPVVPTFEGRFCESERGAPAQPPSESAMAEGPGRLLLTEPSHSRMRV
ncbi:hypothetical protein GCM10009771_07010 [Nesterenkonia flava]